MIWIHSSIIQLKAGVRATAQVNHLLDEYTGELTYEPSNYARAVLTFSKAHSTTQAMGESAEIVSRDPKSELLKRHVKRPIIHSSLVWCNHAFLWLKSRNNTNAARGNTITSKITSSLYGDEKIWKIRNFMFRSLEIVF